MLMLWPVIFCRELLCIDDVKFHNFELTLVGPPGIDSDSESCSHLFDGLSNESARTGSSSLRKLPIAPFLDRMCDNAGLNPLLHRGFQDYFRVADIHDKSVSSRGHPFG